MWGRSRRRRKWKLIGTVSVAAALWSAVPASAQTDDYAQMGLAVFECCPAPFMGSPRAESSGLRAWRTGTTVFGHVYIQDIPPADRCNARVWVNILDKNYRLFRAPYGRFAFDEGNFARRYVQFHTYVPGIPVYIERKVARVCPWGIDSVQVRQLDTL